MVSSGKKMKSLLKNSLLQICLTILMFLGATDAYGGSATVNKVWLEHGSMKNGEKGMTIHVDFNVIGLKGKTINVIAYFYDSNKKKLTGGIGSYKATDGQVCSSDTDKPIYDNSHWSDFDIFIPYSALPLKSGEHDYYIQVSVYDKNSGTFIDNNNKYVKFSGTGNGKGRNVNNANEMVVKRHVVKTWSSTAGVGSSAIVSNFTKYSDGIVEEERQQSCPIYTLCSYCSGMGCYACYGTGRMKCPTCKGVGYTISKSQYLELMEKYSNGREGISVYYFYMTGADFYQGTRKLYSTKQLQDCGTYWKFGQVSITKNLQTLTYLNKQYHKCTDEEYKRLYGDEIKRSTDNYYKALETVRQNNNGSVGGYGSSGNNGSSEAQTRSCSICYGSGWVPLSLGRLVTYENSTDCNLSFYGDHTCHIVQCNTCRQSHCDRLNHRRCKSCNGTGKEKVY